MNSHEIDTMEQMLTDWGDRQCGRGAETCLTIPEAARLVADGEADPTQAEHIRACPACARLVGRLEAGDGTVVRASGNSGRWIFSAAAAAVVILCASLWAGLSARSTRRIEALEQAAAHRREEIASLHAEAAGRQERIGALQRELADTAKENTQVVAQLQRQMELGRTATDRARLRADDLAATVARISRELDAAGSGAAEVRTTLAAREREVTALRGRHDEQAAASARHVSELTEQIRQVRSIQESRAQADRALWRVLLPAGSEPRIDRSKMESMQGAVRTAGLADRAATLAATAEDVGTGGLLNRLEAVLLRLDMADPGDAREQQWLSRAVAGDTLRQIDARLNADTETLSEAERGFLTQMHLIFLRGASAG